MDRNTNKDAVEKLSEQLEKGLLNDGEYRLLQQVCQERLITTSQLDEVLLEKEKEKSTHTVQILLRNQWITTQDYVRILTNSESGFEKIAKSEQERTTISEGKKKISKKTRKVKNFGKYILLKKLGQGGMSIVYKAMEKETKQAVALKILITGRIASLDEKARFRKEIDAMTRLQHENIVSIYDVGEEKGITYYTMAHIRGKCLKDFAAKLSLEKSAEIMIKVCNGIYHAHQAKIIHRDIKPENILLDEKGNPYIADFGLAKDISEISSLTASGTCIGSPLYMSPEQAKGRSKDVSFTSDIYSLGATFYHFLTGKPPFISDVFVDLLNAIIHQNPMAPSKINSHLPPQIDGILLKAMHKNPRKRYATAKEMAQDIDACVKGDTIKANIPIGQRLQILFNRHPVPAVSICLVIVLFVALVAGSFFSQKTSAQNKKTASTKNSKKITPKKIEKKKNNETSSEKDLAEQRKEQKNQIAAKRLAILMKFALRYEIPKRIEMYQKFISRHPNTPAQEMAKRRISELQTRLERQASEFLTLLRQDILEQRERNGLKTCLKRIRELQQKTQEKYRNTNAYKELGQWEAKYSKQVEDFEKALALGNEALSDKNFPRARHFLQQAYGLGCGPDKTEINNKLTQISSIKQKDENNALDKFLEKFVYNIKQNELHRARKLCDQMLDDKSSESARKQLSHLRSDIAFILNVRRMMYKGLIRDRKRLFYQRQYWQVDSLQLDKMILARPRMKITVRVSQINLKDAKILGAIPRNKLPEFWKGLALYYYYCHDYTAAEKYFLRAEKVGVDIDYYMEKMGIKKVSPKTPPKDDFNKSSGRLGRKEIIARIAREPKIGTFLQLNPTAEVLARYDERRSQWNVRIIHENKLMTTIIVNTKGDIIQTIPGQGAHNMNKNFRLIERIVLDFDLLDSNNDGKISQEEWRGPMDMFRVLDANRDNYVTVEELQKR